MNKLPVISSLPIKSGQRVLVRLDVNAPIAEGKVANAYRLRQTLPTIKYLRRQGAAVIILGHLGRPNGQHDKQYSLRPAASWFTKILHSRVLLLDPLFLKKDWQKIQSLKSGQVVMLENLRFYKGEEDNDKSFAQKLAQLGQWYVNDAFGASHRAHASIDSLAKLLPAAAGLLMWQEVRALEKIIHQPRRPLVAVMGGAKISTKLPVLKSLLNYCDIILIGGAMANTALAAKGVPVGLSPVEKSLSPLFKNVVRNKKIILPRDVVSFSIRQESRIVAVGRTGARDINNDIGSATVADFIDHLKKAKTVVWNGPLGWIEHKPFNKGTVSVAKALAGCKAYTVVGGGETVEIIQKLGLTKKFSWVSTGGGAMLEFLSGTRLPGLKALGYYNK